MHRQCYFMIYTYTCNTYYQSQVAGTGSKTYFVLIKHPYTLDRRRRWILHVYLFVCYFIIYEDTL